MTSRDSLAGLVARDGCQRLELDCFAEEEALELLRRLVGDRAEAELEVAAVLARQCGRLPLALRLVAELAAARPGELLADLAAELAHDQQRLDLLDAGGDPQTNVRAVFSWSFRRLPDSCARAFRLLGRHASHHGVDAQAAAAMTGTTVSEARRILRTLAREHLVHRVGPGRYAMNDLLRAYATDMTRHGSAPRSGGLSVAVDRSGRGGRASCLRIRLGRGPIARPLNGRPGHNSRYPGTCGRVYSLR